MTDYISREAFIKQLQEKYEYLPKEVFFPGMKTALEIARELPAADVQEVKRGKWKPIKPYNNTYMGFECSECGAQFQGIHMDNYCGNCGAKMEATPSKEE